MMTKVLLDVPRLLDLHDQLLAHRGFDRDMGDGLEPIWRQIAFNHYCNTALWEEEDQARRRDVPDSAIAANKRAIDGHNQKRNDAVERVDELLLGALTEVSRAADARLSSETAGAMVDRLSILALKVHHMRIQTQRSDASAEHIASCVGRFEKLVEQRTDLCACLARLLDECSAGSTFFKVYRQFKMYNDATMNPYLYRSAPRSAGA